ncbi:MAG TPA: hypothetical protein VG223_17415 [Solirubrobacteraceae bacterium]|jgi:hypothetical protein|nr:hypothetical protein [Solirubrobacteraceae bacterium]
MDIFLAHKTDLNATAVTAGASVRAQITACMAGSTPCLAERFLR